ncbi:tripartite tricarboxylate transporter TctB family protein [Dongia sp.]|uniref:tripartite tricarboxylate transporter TctB family protein n=1 Tax=Dongia sp. TaxID=1977262 RepID=UPI0035B45EC6
MTSPKYQPGGVQHPASGSGGFQRWQGIVIGAVLLALGAGISIVTLGVQALPGQDSLGPRLFPVLIGGGLIILGLANAWSGWTAMRQGVPHEGALIPVSEEENAAGPGDTEQGDWPTLLWVIAGLCLGALGYKAVGFIPSAWLVFVLTARGFAGRWSMRHALVGLAVVLVAFLGFTKGLGLPLPGGLLTGLLGGH